MSCSWFINETRLWNVSSCSSKNYSLSSILPVVPFLSDHSFDFNIPLAQPLVSTMWTPKSFNFDGQFALIIPVPIGMTIFLEITPPAMHTPVTTSFTFTRNLSSKRFSLPCLICTVALLLFFVSFIVFVSYKNLSCRDLVPFIKAYLPTSFVMLSGTEVL